MKNTIIKFISILMFLCLLVGCENRKVSVKVVVTYWNGWDSEYVSPVEEHEFEFEESKSYEIPANFGDFQLVVTITKISDTEITITTNEAMCISENGSMNLTEAKLNFTIAIDEGLKLVTPTLDEGAYYEFSVNPK